MKDAAEKKSVDFMFIAKGALPTCPHCRAQVVETVVQHLARNNNMDPSETVMTLLTAAAHLYMRHFTPEGPLAFNRGGFAEAWKKAAQHGLNTAEEWFPEDMPGASGATAPDTCVH